MFSSLLRKLEELCCLRYTLYVYLGVLSGMHDSKLCRELILSETSTFEQNCQCLQMRQNNAEIAKAEEKIKQVEDEVKNYEEKIAEADNSLSELKGLIHPSFP